MTLTCCCCGHDHFAAAGSYMLSTRSDVGLSHGPDAPAYPLVSCANCSHVMVHPVPSEEEIRQYYLGVDFWRNRGFRDESGSRGWREILTSNSSVWERYHRARLQLRFLLDHVGLPADARILDCGSGLAPFLYHCRQMGFTNLHALEPSAEVCRFLDRQGVVTYPMLLETFITRNDLPRFDLIVLSHVVEHLGRPGELLEGLRRLLSDRAILLVETPYQDHLSPYPRGLHLHFFNEVSLNRLLTKCGYKVIVTQSRRFNPLEAAASRILYLVYGKFFLMRRRGTVNDLLEHRFVKLLHRFGLRPLKRLVGLKINIFIDSQDLMALATR